MNETTGNSAKKILIIEDDKKMVAIYKVAFEKEKYDVHVAYDGEQALEALSNLKPDLIILDIILPKIDGMTVLERIRERDEFSKVPILIVSNVTDKQQVNMGVSLGAQDYILKPDMTIDYLLLKINTFLH